MVVPQGPALIPATFVRMYTNNVLSFLAEHIIGYLAMLSSHITSV